VDAVLAGRAEIDSSAALAEGLRRHPR